MKEVILALIGIVIIVAIIIWHNCIRTYSNYMITLTTEDKSYTSNVRVIIYTSRYNDFDYETLKGESYVIVREQPTLFNGKRYFMLTSTIYNEKEISYDLFYKYENLCAYNGIYIEGDKLV